MSNDGVHPGRRREGDRPSRALRPRSRTAAPRVALAAALAAGTACANTSLDLFDPDVGLLAHWALDESEAGAVAVDSSGFGLAGTPSTNPPTPTRDVPPVRFANAHSLSFNGRDQWIDMGNPALLNLGGVITIAAWVRPAATDGYRDVVAHGYRTSPNRDLALRIRNGNYEFTMWDSVDHAAIAAIPAADAGAWVHLCGVFDGATYFVYRNGEVVAATADATAPPPNIEASWTIGARAADRQWQGQIDDVRIYGRALSAAEAAQLARR